ncbi:MAG: 50S ribosomal protein L30 [Syntrophomonadaceae bacterium]|nr:50S ribosomal protein L30 [Syntrophomonadaceae bacterium]
MAKMLKITLVKSTIGRPEDQKKTARALGLSKLNSVVTKCDTPDIRGQVNKLRHLVEVLEYET